MKNLFSLFILLLVVGLVQTFGQSSNLEGILVDESEQPVPFANVAVYNSVDSSLVTGAVSNLEGKYFIGSLDSGSYFLKISAIGYETAFSQNFSFTDINEAKTFAPIVLKEDIKQLNEVVIKSFRESIVVEADKIIVDIEGRPLSAGKSAFEVVKNLPGVWVDHEGNVKLNGKSGVNIMLNGRSSYMSAKELKGILEGLSAENVKNIEIITNPSAEYDAEGTSGIININLKKNALDGFNGNVYAGYQMNGIHGYSTGGALYFKKNKFNSFINLNLAKSGYIKEIDMVRKFQNENNTVIDQHTDDNFQNITPSVRFGLDYKINPRHNISTVLNILQYNSNLKVNSETNLNNGFNNSFIVSNNLLESRNINKNINLHYLGKMDTIGSSVSFDIDYITLSKQEYGSFNNLYQYQSSDTLLERMINKNPNKYRIFSAKTDFTKVLKREKKLNFGAKFSAVNSDNLLLFYTLEDDIKILDEKRSNHFLYSENILAAYAIFSSKLRENINFKAGLRMEQTFSEGNSVTIKQTSQRRYLDLFPSIFIKQKLTDNYSIVYNYSRRINRPRYESLNPFIFYVDPYTRAVGNPFLKPQYSNNFQIIQTFKNSYNLNLSYQNTKDFISEVPEPNSQEATTVFMQRNLDKFNSINASIIAPFDVTNNWQINNSLLFSYQYFENESVGAKFKNEQMMVLAKTNHIISLGEQVKLEISGTYRSPFAYALYSADGAWWVDMGLNKSMMDGKMELNFNITDIFRTNKLNSTAHLGDNLTNLNIYPGAQSFAINLRYKFNKGEKVEVYKGNKIEEVLRTE